MSGGAQGGGQSIDLSQISQFLNKQGMGQPQGGAQGGTRANMFGNPSQNINGYTPAGQPQPPQGGAPATPQPPQNAMGPNTFGGGVNPQGQTNMMKPMPVPSGGLMVGLTRRVRATCNKRSRIKYRKEEIGLGWEALRLTGLLLWVPRRSRVFRTY